MAGRTVPPLPLPSFPQSIFDIERRGDPIDQAPVGSLLTACSYESAASTYGECDGLPCTAKAAAYKAQTEQEYCAKHFRGVSRG
jgi:hypothetical protein